MRLTAVLLLALLPLPVGVTQAAAYEKAYIDGISPRLRDPSPKVRERAAMDAFNAGEDAAPVVPALVDLLLRERDRDVRDMAVDALGSVGKSSAMAGAALAPVLRADSEIRTRVKAAEALQRLGTAAPQAVPALLAALADASSEVRQAAAEALGSYPGHADVVVPALAAGLGDEDVAAGGLLALRAFGAAAAPAVPALRQFIAAPGSNEFLRRRALWTLVRIGATAVAAEPECVALLQHSDPGMRVAAASALLALGRQSEPAMQALRASLSTNQGRTDLASVEQRRDVVIDAANTLQRHAALAGGEALVGLATAAADRISSEMQRNAAQAFDEVLAALVKARHFDAIASLDEAARFLAASQDEATRVRSRRVTAAAEELRRLRPATGRLRELLSGPAGAAAAATAVVVSIAAMSVWRWRRRAPGCVFISYRRQDSASTCGRLVDHLVARLGRGSVFRDLDSLEPGTPFAQRLQEAVGQCDAFIVLIGPAWLTVKNASGGRRLDDPADLVRLEIEAALAAARPMFPVLLEGAAMPAASELPPSIAGLASSNALELTDRHFASEVERLVAAIRGSSARRGLKRRSPTLLA
jgi:hypothetical protein